MAEQKSSSRKVTRKTVATGITFSAEETSVSTPVLPTVEVTRPPMTALLFQEPDVTRAVVARRTRKSAQVAEEVDAESGVDSSAEQSGRSRRGVNSEGAPEVGRKSRRGTRGGRNSDDAKTKEDQSATGSEQVDAHLSTGDADVAPAQDASATTSTRTRRRKRAEVVDGAADAANSELANESEIDNASNSAVSAVRGSAQAGAGAESATVRRRRRRSKDTVELEDEVTAPKGSTRLEAKRQRRKEGRESGRRRHSISESEFLARRESVNREMLIRERDGLNQIAVIEDGVLVEHYVARHTQSSMVGNVYLGRVQNVLPSMEAAFVDIGKGRNAVLYAGEVNWDAAGMEGKPRKIEDALKSGDTVLVQVTKDPIGHKGARLTGQVTLAGRHLVLVPGGAMTGISRKLPDVERNRLKRLLKEIVPSEHGVIVRTAAEGATDEQLRSDVSRLIKSWEKIDAKAKSSKNAPALLKGEPELAVRVVRDVFNEDFDKLKISGETAWETVSDYVTELSPELADRMERWTESKDLFAAYRVDEQLQKAFDRKVFLPSGGSLVIDRTEAMTVIDVNTGKFTGTGGTLEETVTRNNLEAAEEIVRQLRLRDIGGIVVIDFIDMVLEANRDLVLRRLIECLGRDRTRHQVAEVTSLGLVQMTRKRVGQGLVEAFSTTCEACEGRGYITHEHPVEKGDESGSNEPSRASKAAAKNSAKNAVKAKGEDVDPKQAEVKAALANIAAAAAHKHVDSESSADTTAVDGGVGAEASTAQEKESSVPEKAPKEPKARKRGTRNRATQFAADAGESKAPAAHETPKTDARAEEKASVEADLQAELRVEAPKKRGRRERGVPAQDALANMARLEAALDAVSPKAESETTQPSVSVTAGAQSEPTVTEPKKRPQRRRVTSTGTITPTSTSNLGGPGGGSDAPSFAIMTFPAKKAADES